MNQRSKRARDRRRAEQDIGASAMNMGGHIASHRRDADPVVRVPQKTTGDVSPEKAKGLAKASPFFKKLTETLSPRTKAEEKNAIEESTEEVVDEKDDEEEDAD